MASRFAFTFGLLAGLALILALAEGYKYKPYGTAKCTVKKYKHCYNRVYFCPRNCRRYCHVDCVSCKPVCSKLMLNT